MSPVLFHDPVLAEFRHLLEELYGDQLERAVLFGSRARGDERADSDYDVAVFLKAPSDWWAELDRLALPRIEMLRQSGAFFDVKPYHTSEWAERTALMGEIRREGIPF